MTAPTTINPPKSLTTRVIKAEANKLLRQGGIRIGLLVAVLLGLLTAAFVYLGPIAWSSLEFVVTSSNLAGMVRLAQVMPIYALIIVAATFVPREISAGTMVLSKTLVPRPGYLYSIKLLVWFAVSAGVAALVSAVLLAGGLLTPTLDSSNLLGALLQFVTTTMLVAILSTLTFELAVIFKRGALTLMIYLLAMSAVPIVLNVAEVLLPPNVNSVVGAVGNVLPHHLVDIASKVPGTAGPIAGTNPWLSFALGWLGLTIWFVALAFLSYRSFAKSTFGDSQ